MLTKEQEDEIYRRALAACRPKSPPPPKPPEQQWVERCANKPLEVAVQDAAAHNNHVIERLEETMETRRQKQMAKELAEFNAESPLWRSLVHWRQSIERAQERIRDLDGEIPEKGIYDPIRRFEREMRGR
jgi:hypothetical protein